MRLEVLAPETGKALRDMGDVIDYYLSHGNQAQIKIFYLNPASFPEDRFFDPYSAYLVDQSHVAPKHYTVSIQGVVQVMQGGEAVFTSLGDFIREKSTFKMLRTIKFFKQYHQRKFFHLWRSMVRWNLFRRTRAKIGQRLFLVKPAFQDTVMVLLEARTLLEDSRMLVGDYKDVHGETPKLYSGEGGTSTGTLQGGPAPVEQVR